jgi:hypothetical protein
MTEIIHLHSTQSRKSHTLNNIVEHHHGTRPEIAFWQGAQDSIQGLHLLCKNIVPETDKLKRRAYFRVLQEFSPLKVGTLVLLCSRPLAGLKHPRPWFLLSYPVSPISEAGKES